MVDVAPHHENTAHTSVRTSLTCIAVDWSGALRGEHRRMWLAEARDGRLVRLECGRDRPALIAELCASAARTERLVVGLGFAFSLPAWFLERRALAGARALWSLVGRDGEEWLRACTPPFWGRPGVPRPALVRGRSPWRATEGECVAARGVGPKDVFQIGGAGTVGTASLRGMPWLVELERAGFAVWPFSPVRFPLVCEIYPRDLTGPVDKSSRVARALRVQARLAYERVEHQRAAEASEDAFDAALSAVEMSLHARQFATLPPARNAREQLEGRIWRPRVDPLHAALRRTTFHVRARSA